MNNFIPVPPAELGMLQEQFALFGYTLTCAADDPRPNPYRLAKGGMTVWRTASRATLYALVTLLRNEAGLDLNFGKPA